MDMLKTGWNFFQNEVLGMAWLNRLIGNLINACGLDATSKIGGNDCCKFNFSVRNDCSANAGFLSR